MIWACLPTRPVGAHAAGYTYQWSGPNGFTSTEQNPDPQCDARGQRQLHLTVTEGNASACAKTRSVEVSGIVEPVNRPVITATGAGCEGDLVTLSIPAYGGSSVTYTWSTPLATTQDISGQGTNVLTIDRAASVHTGSYSVTVVVDGCTQTSAPYTLDIDARPVVAPTASYTLAPDCSVSDLDLAANATGTRGRCHLCLDRAKWFCLERGKPNPRKRNARRERQLLPHRYRRERLYGQCIGERERYRGGRSAATD